MFQKMQKMEKSIWNYGKIHWRIEIYKRALNGSLGSGKSNTWLKM